MTGKIRFRYLPLFTTLLILYIVLVPHVSTLISAVIMLALLLFNFNIRNFKFQKGNLGYCILFFGIILTLVGTVIHYNKTVVSRSAVSTSVIKIGYQNLRYLIYLVLALLALRMLVYVLKKQKYENVFGYIERIISIFLILFLIFFVIQRINYDVYSKFKSLYYVVNVDLRENEALNGSDYFLRYSFIFLDPNNCGYCVSMAAMYLYRSTSNRRYKILAFICLITTPIATISRGATVGIILFFICISTDRIRSRKKVTVYELIGLCLLLAAVIAVVYSMAYGSDSFFEGDIADRLSSHDDSRVKIWTNICKTLGVPPLIGEGYVLHHLGLYLKPHSDILRLLYGYGLIPFCAAVWFMGHNLFGTKISLCIIPIGLAVIMNSVIDEPRVLWMTVLIIACIIVQKEKQKEQNGKTDLLGHE